MEAGRDTWLSVARSGVEFQTPAAVVSLFISLSLPLYFRGKRVPCVSCGKQRAGGFGCCPKGKVQLDVRTYHLNATLLFPVP